MTSSKGSRENPFHSIATGEAAERGGAHKPMKVKVRFSRWDTGYPARGSAVPKVSQQEQPAERWQYPPRYEVRTQETHEKVVPIWVEPPVQKAEVLPIRPGKNSEPEVVTPGELAEAMSHLLNPAAVLALALAVWGLIADFGLANSFAVNDGPFSHWQTWGAVAGGIHLTSRTLRKRSSPPADHAGTGTPVDPER